MDARRNESCGICRTLITALQNRRTCDEAACVFAYQQHLRTGRPTCTECGRPLFLVEESHGAAVCGDMQCQANFGRRQGTADSPHCCVCRRRLTSDCVSDGVCRDLVCRDVQRWRQQTELVSERHTQFVEQTRLAALRRDELASAAGIASPEEFFVTVVPLFANRLSALSDERRQAFRERIESLLSEHSNESDANLQMMDEPQASTGDAVKSAASRDGERLVGAICAACRGFCCRRGDTHAYLRLNTLRRLLRRRPELSVSQIADVYADYLPAQSFADSCVFHGEAGCTLPRELRSDTCNAHYCDGQQNLRAAMEQGAPPRAFVAISDGTQIVAGQFLDANAERVADIRAPH